ncbi:ATP-binding cassette domain-containing protein [Labrys monachus]|uniref:Ribose transport system ATP-binding protein n=1 Tax=Labrys monachus TaxID=217067 RepID=A0ABU0FKY7_9HYPH|nr:ATP-binding cassette domain-containing protein [Labrys monachus]MDQ0394758.1 ribose transport system ATP-binding protein [Labrys monachus]
MLDVQDLSKNYGETRALEGVSIGFEKGTIHAVLGENGSGKSTLVKLLSGIVMPSRGRILVEGRPLTAFTPAAMQAAGLATVFQEVLLAPDRTVTDNILLGCDGLLKRNIPRGRRRDVAAEALSRITATPIDLDAAAGDLPLAIRQLIVLARALARRPRLLILDEITAALDFGDREAVFRTMEKFAADGGLILFISHRMDEVMRLAARISVLRNGRLVETLARRDTSPDALLRLMAPAAAKELAHAG